MTRRDDDREEPAHAERRGRSPVIPLVLLGVVVLLLAGGGYVRHLFQRQAARDERDAVIRMREQEARAEAERLRLELLEQQDRVAAAKPTVSEKKGKPADAKPAVAWHDATTGPLSIGSLSIDVTRTLQDETSEGVPESFAYLRVKNGKGGDRTRISGAAINESLWKELTGKNSKTDGAEITDFPGAAITDDSGARYRILSRTAYREGDKSKGLLPRIVLNAGDEVTVCIEFERPRKDAKELRLELPGSWFGQEGVIRLKFPPTIDRRAK